MLRTGTWNQPRVFPLGMTDSDSYYYIRERSGDDVFTLRMNWSGSLDRTAAARLTDRSPDANLGPAWSPDNRRVAFWRRPTERCPMGSCGMHLVIRSVATNEGRVYTEGFLESAPIIWTPDGRSGGTPIEAVVLHDKRRPTSRWCGSGR